SGPGYPYPGLEIRAVNTSRDVVTTEKTGAVADRSSTHVTRIESSLQQNNGFGSQVNPQRTRTGQVFESKRSQDYTSYHRINANRWCVVGRAARSAETDHR